MPRRPCIDRAGACWLASAPGWLAWTRRDTTQTNSSMNGLNQVKTWAGGLPANWDDQFGLGNGTLIQDGNFTAWYNALNQPMWFATNAHAPGYATFLAYDPLGRCVKRWTAPNNATGAAVTNNPALYLYYDGWNLIQEGDGAGTPEQVYVHGSRVDEIVARYRWGFGWYFHHYDGRTHCQMVTYETGAVVERYAYDAFGWPYLYNGSGTQLTLVNGRPVSAVGNRFLFTGREWLTDWGIYDYRHRQYHPLMGRFLQPDPKHFGAGDYNLYRYCHNDPVNIHDPDGLDARLIQMRDPYYAGSDPRLSASTLQIWENGRFIGATRVNENGFIDNRRGVPAGHYLVLPKAEDGNVFPKGTPAITSPEYASQPGRTNAGHPEGSVLIHGEGAPGKPDSRACMTLKPDPLNTVKEVMDRNPGTTTLDVYDGPRITPQTQVRQAERVGVSAPGPSVPGWIYGVRRY